MSVYGLTGGIGSGKSTVVNLLQESGIAIVLADDVGRQVVAKGSAGLNEVVAAFGNDVLNEHGELNRQSLARLIFGDTAKRHQLESIMHPLVRQYSQERFRDLEKAGHQIVVYESALLFESQRHTEMKGVILVTASEEQRIARVRARDGADEEAVRNRIKAQMGEEEKRKLVDYVIDNHADMDNLRRQVNDLIAQIQKRESEDE